MGAGDAPRLGTVGLCSSCLSSRGVDRCRLLRQHKAGLVPDAAVGAAVDPARAHARPCGAALREHRPAGSPSDPS